MNKYEEMLFEESSRRYGTGGTCPFCEEAINKQEWMLENKFNHEPDPEDIETNCTEDMCPYMNYITRIDGDAGALSCNRRGSRVWQDALRSEYVVRRVSK